jgi:hypothetical protein
MNGGITVTQSFLILGSALTEKMSGSGGEVRLAPDCFFDCSSFAAIIPSQFVDGLTGLVTLRDNAGRYGFHQVDERESRNCGNWKLYERLKKTLSPLCWAITHGGQSADAKQAIHPKVASPLRQRTPPFDR